MKTAARASSSVLPLDCVALPRYRVCGQSVAGESCERRFSTDSAEAAVREFLTTGPFVDGSDLYIWDRHKKRIVAQIAWTNERTTFGTLRVRTNEFHDPILVAIASRLVAERMEIRRAIVNSVAV